MFPTPTVVGDQLLLASCAGWLFSVDRHTGEQQWRFDIKEGGALQFHSEMLIYEDRVVVGNDGTKGNGQAIDLQTGEELWRYDCGTALRVDLQRFEHTVIGVAKRDGIDELFSLDLETGSPRWTIDHDRGDGTAFGNTPAIIGDQVWFGSASGVFVYDAHSGDVIDAVDLGGPISTSLLATDRHLYMGVGQELLRLDLDTREIDGRFDLGGKLVGRPALLGDSIGVLVNWRTPRSRLVVLDSKLETLRWEWTPEVNSHYGTIARLHTYDDFVLMGTQSGRIFGLDVNDGSILWETSIDEAVRAALIHDGVLYIGTIPGPVYAIKMGEGKKPSRH